MRRLPTLFLTACLVLPACGSSGGAGGSSPALTLTPDPNSTRTATRTRGPSRTPTRTGGPTYTATRTGGPTNTARPTRTPGPPVTLFVSQNGTDSNPGFTAEQPLRTVEFAAKLLTPGSTMYVGRGVYRGRVAVTNVAGTEALPVRILADRSGEFTGDPNGDVILDADGASVGLIITNSPFVTVDGFILRGVAPALDPPSAAVAVRVRGGSDVAVVQHCVIANAATADGIRVDSSSDVLLFNNLVFAADRGIVVTGSARRTQIINNSVALTNRAGISLRASGGAEPSDTQVINNVLQETGPNVGIDASGGTEGYAGDYNLVFQPEAEDPTAVYNPPEGRGANDLNVDPLIVNIAAGDLHLEPGSPAVDSGSGRIDSALEEALLARSTNSYGSRDRAPVDRGYHYPR